jgi:asparagine synthase (glutamine-hydrolysing)
MCALGVWDKQEELLHLVRDRIGIKPLYYGWVNGAFVFASELKAFQKIEDFQNDVDRTALAGYMRRNYVPGPRSIYQDIKKLPPGCVITIGNDTVQRREVPEPESYWSLDEVTQSGQNNPFSGTGQEAVDILHELLKDAVKCRMVADVPLGAFLSGGIDSSTVVALMQEQQTDSVRTFSIGFHDDKYNEATYAKEVANHLGTDHTEFHVGPEKAMDIIPKLPYVYDEPFADSSQIPTYLVSHLARKKVKVSLSGDGGDELFGGYGRYFLAQRIWNYIGWVPAALRSGVGWGLSNVSTKTWQTIYESVSSVLPQPFRGVKRPGVNAHKLADVMTGTQGSFYHGLLYDKYSTSVVRGGGELNREIESFIPRSIDEFIHRMMYYDSITYLPDDILVKVDRASMGVSLESRVPLLDHRIAEFAWRLPLNMKVRNGNGKWVLRQVLYKYVPKEIIDRPKMGFGVPVGKWLRGPLRDWAEALLDQSRLEEEGYFRPEPIREMWKQHIDGKKNWQYRLWNVLMFQSWYETYEN